MEAFASLILPSDQFDRERRILHIVESIVEQISDVDGTWLRVKSDSMISNSLTKWNVDGLSNGTLPAALFLTHVGEIWPSMETERLIHEHIKKAFDNLHNFDLPHTGNLGLFGGFTGFCFSLYLCTRNGAKYESLMSQLDSYYIGILEASLDSFLVDGPDPYRSFDVISGSSGVIRYLLERYDDKRFADICDVLVSDLVKRSGTVFSDRGFLVSRAYLPLPFHRERYPNGRVDLGFAHGIAGALASLSLVKSSGIVAPNIDEALLSLVKALKEHQLRNRSGIHWPVGFGPASNYNEHPAQLAWCYGAPGVATAMLRASIALQNDEIANFAFSVMTELLEDQEGVRHVIRNPCLCHGCAGLLSMVRLFASVRPLEVLSCAESFLELYLIGLWDNRQREFLIEGEERVFPRFDLLDGGIGSSLALLSSVENCSSRWQQLLLLR